MFSRPATQRTEDPLAVGEDDDGHVLGGPALQDLLHAALVLQGDEEALGAVRVVCCPWMDGWRDRLVEPGSLGWRAQTHAMNGSVDRRTHRGVKMWEKERQACPTVGV